MENFDTEKGVWRCGSWFRGGEVTGGGGGASQKKKVCKKKKVSIKRPWEGKLITRAPGGRGQNVAVRERNCD